MRREVDNFIQVVFNKNFVPDDQFVCHVWKNIYFANNIANIYIKRKCYLLGQLIYDK